MRPVGYVAKRTHRSPCQICPSTSVRHRVLFSSLSLLILFFFAFFMRVNVQRLCKASVYLPICAHVCV